MSKSSVKRKKDSRLSEAKKLKETSKETSDDDGYEETQIKTLKRKKGSKNASPSKKPKLDTSNTIKSASTNNVQDKVNDENRNENINFNNNLESIAWPNADIERLFANIESQLPQDDSMTHQSRIEKINWYKVKFGNYTKVECKRVFKQIHEHIRSFRILQEVLHDAREWLRLRPDRPVSPFAFFCAKNRNDIEKQNPTSCEGNVIRLMKIMFNELSPEKKTKIEKAAAGEPYISSDEDTDIKEEIVTDIDSTEKPPKKAQTAFNLYMQAESQSSADDMRTQIFRLRCKVQYKSMSDKCKMHWIKLAEQDLERFQRELKVYQEKYPDYKTKVTKSILTKDEHMVKERVCGVPLKPPSSSYALFAQTMLQSKEIKEINAKERLNHVAGLWRSLQPEEKTVYEADFMALKDKYKGEYEEYVKTLPEEEQSRLKESKKKRSKKKKRTDGPSTSKKPTKIKFDEPKAPPVSVKKYFLSLVESDNPTAAWRALDSKSKRKYEDELTALKKTYIKNYEKFLNSLSESEVKQFAALKNQNSDKNSASETDSDFDDEDDEDDDEECNDEDSGDCD